MIRFGMIVWAINTLLSLAVTATLMHFHVIDDPLIGVVGVFTCLTVAEFLYFVFRMNPPY